MKRFLALVSFLVFAAACTNQPMDNKNMTSNANTGKEMKSTGTAPSLADLQAKETAGWEAVKKKDWDAFGKLLASDYIEALDDGVHDKTATLQLVKDLDLTDYTLSDWKLLPIDKDAAIVTYTATSKGTFKGQPFPPGPYREAAAYVNRNGEWVAIYYQETLVEKSAPPPPPPKAAASPATKPAEPGPDPIANEKIVWDAFRNRDYDAFAALLAPEFTEIEANAVMDKAASIEDAKAFDANQYDLSDWKSAKFDDDATFVTYTVTPKGANPRKEYHSSIWVNRNGKWQGLFHMGTPETPPEKK
jgi:hypothetical protein